MRLKESINFKIIKPKNFSMIILFKQLDILCVILCALNFNEYSIKGKVPGLNIKVLPKE
ncbi:hypothetical protein J2S02_000754 [Metabacillus niabensis]|uniref:Uncharacterized protein n=1 Tax=Metabacillus niabensis TaxID=324854 RepID=A0ABT9YWV8_9BACI|nr:hypothetical protein [Metabacillus niabensis]